MTTGNHFLDTLPPADRDALAALLRPLRVEAGQVLVEQGEPIETVHFPTTAQLANVTLTDTGSSVETAVIGREGLSGLAPFMADTPCAWRIQARIRGDVLAAPAAELRRRMGESPDFLARLLTLTHFYQLQAVQTAVCNALHRVRPRVARWLLTASDLTPASDVRFTQEEMAAMLGAQRTSVVEAYAGLKAANLIRHSRGSARILDRPGLIREACSCYGVLRRHAEDLGVLPMDGGGLE